jgi:type II restriction/modification system DNA methylase subunit YeeA
VTPDKFIAKWGAAELSESSAAQQHFLDLCELLGQVPPAEADPTGETFTFEKGGATATGGHGWADVWKKGAFAWEYKGPGKDLQAAYYQLKKYADALENPPLLITSDLKRIEIHTNFTNTVKVVHVLQLEDLKDPAKRDVLRHAFASPEKLRPGVTRHMVTKEAAERFSELAHHLQAKGYDPQRVAHFLNRLIFCMFAEDVGLLPNKIFSKLAIASVTHPETFETNAKQLFGGMSKGGSVAFEVIDWFNGGLFDDDSTLPLDKKELELVVGCAELDWSDIEPSIFGTLFERGLDPDKRSQQGTHYTDPETIMKIVGPVVLEPWARQWEEEKAALSKLADKAKKGISEAAQKRYLQFLERLHHYRVLDPACGSGNFLYLALRGLKDFEKRVILEAELLGLPRQFPRVGPEAVLGIEVNPYAAELARVTIWIGELQWMIDNGFGASKNPILKPLDQIECRDAILNEDGSEPTWPKADVIVGNPPFLGRAFLEARLGQSYMDRLRNVYKKRLNRGVDLVTYWFVKATQMVLDGPALRAGLVGTSSIRGGSNRKVLDRIVGELRVFEAWSEQDWVNDGATVHVSLVCFERKTGGTAPRLNGVAVNGIYGDLSPESALTADISRAATLAENDAVAHQGIVLRGSFRLTGPQAREMLLSGGNPNGRPNSDVLRRHKNAMDIVRRDSDTWVVDFAHRSEHEAATYEKPFGFLLEYVRPERALARQSAALATWWLHWRPRPEIRAATATLMRYIATPTVSKHRIFVWLDHRVSPDHQLIVFMRDDDFVFGVLHSRQHELWALRLGSALDDRPRYTPTSTFETFPFPDGMTPNIPFGDYRDHPCCQSVVIAAKRLNELRENWLNPAEFTDRIPEIVAGYPDRVVAKSPDVENSLKRRTLTNLYNDRPAWLKHAHDLLDAAVAAAYGWEWPLTDDEILKRLFELNKDRAAAASNSADTTRTRRPKKDVRAGTLF